MTDEKAFDRDCVTSDSIKDEDCFTEEFWLNFWLEVILNVCHTESVILNNEDTSVAQDYKDGSGILYELETDEKPYEQSHFSTSEDEAGVELEWSIFSAFWAFWTTIFFYFFFTFFVTFSVCFSVKYSSRVSDSLYFMMSGSHFLLFVFLSEI